MSKVLATAAIVVGAVGLVATGFGAVGIGIAGLASAKALVTVGAIAGVASGVLSIGANLTAKKPSAQASGSQVNFAADPDAPIPWVLGLTYPAGHVVRRGAAP